MGLITLLVDIGLLTMGAVALGVSAGFVASSAARVTSIDDWKKNNDLKTAHTLLSWSAVFGWIGLAVVIVLIVLYLIFGSESIEFTAGLVSKGLLLITIGLLIVTGSFAAAGAAFIEKSSEADEAKKNGAYTQAIIAAVVAIVGGVLIIGLFLYIMFHKPKNKKDAEKDTKENEDQKDLEELKQKLVGEKEAEIDERISKLKQETK